VLYIDHPVEHPTPSGSRAPSPSRPTEPLPIPSAGTETEKNGAIASTSPVRVPTQAVADSPEDEKFIAQRPAEVNPELAEEKKEVKKELDVPDEQAGRPGLKQTASTTAVINGDDGYMGSENGHGVPNVHAEAEEYYGGKEVVNRSRTYSIVSIPHRGRLRELGRLDLTIFVSTIGRCRGSLETTTMVDRRRCAVEEQALVARRTVCPSSSTVLDRRRGDSEIGFGTGR
jgi:hypothetical protein